MSDNFVQQANLGFGTTTASATLNSVVAGNAIVAVAAVGSTFNPTLHSVSDGTAYVAGASASVSANNVFAQAFYLLNAGAGTHTVTFTTDSGATCDIFVAEIGTTGGAAVAVDTKAQAQINPGTGANALDSGSLTIPSAATVWAVSLDTSSVAGADEPAVGTSPFSFTTRQNGVTSDSGVYRAESAAAGANGSATATAITGTHSFITLGIAISNAAGGAVSGYRLKNQPKKPGLGPNPLVVVMPLGAVQISVDTPLSYVARFSPGRLARAFSSPPAMDQSAPPTPRDESLMWAPVFKAGQLRQAVQSSPDLGLSAPPQPTREQSAWTPVFKPGRLNPAVQTWPNLGFSAAPPPTNDWPQWRGPLFHVAPFFYIPPSTPAGDVPAPPPPSDTPAYYLARFIVGRFAPALNSPPDPGFSIAPPPPDEPGRWAPLFKVNALGRAFISQPDAGFSTAPPPPVTGIIFIVME